jgi:hypothetical protein
VHRAAVANLQDAIRWILPEVGQNKVRQETGKE